MKQMHFADLGLPFDVNHIGAISEIETNERSLLTYRENGCLSDKPPDYQTPLKTWTINPLLRASFTVTTLNGEAALTLYEWEETPTEIATQLQEMQRRARWVFFEQKRVTLKMTIRTALGMVVNSPLVQAPLQDARERLAYKRNLIVEAVRVTRELKTEGYVLV